MSDDPVEDRLTKWLRQISGCAFVPQLISQQRLQILQDAADESTPEALDLWLDGLGEAGLVGVGVFPSLTTEEELVVLLGRLCATGRWRMDELTSLSGAGTCVALEWQTTAGAWSSAMGFAPLMTMPPTRRAPYPALALWPGPPRKTPATTVGFGDVPSNLPKDKHAQSLEASKAMTRDYNRFGNEQAKWRKVAFSFDPETYRRAMGA